MASASVPASIYPRSDSRLPDGSVYTFSRAIDQVIAETRTEIKAEEEAEREEALRQQMARPQMTADELRNGIRKFKESRRKEQFDLNTIDEDWQFPKIVAAAELNVAAERKRQRRLIAAYGGQVLDYDFLRVSDLTLLGSYQTFLGRCIGRTDASRLSDEEIEIRFQFMDQELHMISKYAGEMKLVEKFIGMEYYMKQWQEAKEKHDELTAKLEEFISQHGRQIVSDLI